MRIRSPLFTFASAVFFVLPLATHADTNKTISTIDIPGYAYDVIVADNYAYVANAHDGIAVVNVANPAAPSIIRSVNLPDTPTRVDINNGILFVADKSVVELFSLADRTNPSLLGSYSQSGLEVQDVISNGSYAYVLGTLSGQPVLEVIDVSNTALPVLKSSITVHGTKDVVFSSNYVYVVGGRTLDIISAYPNLAVVSTYTDPISYAYYSSIQVFGSVAYINDIGSGLHAINVSNPASPAVSFESRSIFPYTNYGMGVAISNGYVFLGQNGGGIAIYDIASTGSPVYVETYTGTGIVHNVSIANDVAYVAADTGGLQLVDVSKPDSVPPVVAPVGGSTEIIQPGKPFVDPGLTITDNVGGTGMQVSGSVDTAKVGKYVLTYVVTDRAGNETMATRTVYVAPTLASIALKNNTYTIKVNKKNVVLNPFPGYRGAVIAKKAIIDAVTAPYYVFISTATKKPEMIVYNVNGKLLSRTALKDVSITGVQVAMAANPVTASIYVAFAPTTASAMKVTVYNIAAKGAVKKLSTFTAAGGKGVLVMSFLKMYTNEYGLATKIKNTTKTPYVWRYGGSKKGWYRDVTYALSRLSWTKASITLK